MQMVKMIRRSAFIAKDAIAGTLLSDCEIEYRRPGFGISPKDTMDLFNRKLKHNVSAGSILSLEDLE